MAMESTNLIVNLKGLCTINRTKYLPSNIVGDNQLEFALVLITIGFSVILLLEKFGPENNPEAKQMQ